MYDNQILRAHGKAKAEDLERIEQKFQVKIPTAVREHYLAITKDTQKSLFSQIKAAMYILSAGLFPYVVKKIGLWKIR